MTPEEFSAFCDEWYPQVEKYLYVKVARPELVEDILQNIFTILAKSRERLRPETANRYLWVTARWEGHHARVVTHDAEYNNGLDYRRSASRFPSPEQVACNQLVLEALLADLSDLERFVLERVVLQDHSLKRVAHELQPRSVSPEYIAQILEKALIKISNYDGRRVA